MTRTILSVLALGSLLMGTAEAGPGGIWLCHQADGTEIFTNETKDLKDCRQYVPRQDVEVQVVPKNRDAEVKLTVPLTGDVESIKSLPGKPEETPAKGRIDFSILNRLSVGMSEAEVMSLAGPPKTRHLDTWVYALADSSLVELRFGTGRIVEIRQHQLPQ
jgi:hypothetical protein